MSRYELLTRKSRGKSPRIIWIQYCWRLHARETCTNFLISSRIWRGQRSSRPWRMRGCRSTSEVLFATSRRRKSSCRSWHMIIKRSLRKRCNRELQAPSQCKDCSLILRDVLNQVVSSFTMTTISKISSRLSIAKTRQPTLNATVTRSLWMLKHPWHRIALVG